MRRMSFGMTIAQFEDRTKDVTRRTGWLWVSAGDQIRAVDKAMAVSWPKVPVIPAQSSGASDSMWYRAKGVPSYGISPVFIKDSDDFSHGLNERVEVRNIRPGLTYYFSLLSALSK